jgi:adenosylcobinamide-GDP ribazoletransferase
MREAACLAVGTLTRWPVPAPARVDAATARAAMLLAPWVGVALGALAGALAWLGLRAGLSATLVAALVVAALAYATRGLHLDGLADTADGLGSGGGAERALEVMRRGDVGPFGVSTLVLVLAVQVAALAQVLTLWGPPPAVAAVAAARLVLPVLCRRGVAAARPNGLGAAVSGTVGWPALTADLLVAAGFATVGLALTGGPVWSGAAMVLAASAIGAGVGHLAVRRLGGITGDVLGSAVELALAGALLVLAAIAGAP